MHGKDIHLHSVCVGQTRSVAIVASPEPTAFVKKPEDDIVMAGEEGLAGDVLATGRELGARNHAVYAIPAETFTFWKDRLSRPDLPFGGLGENIVLDCPDEDTVAIGDRLEIGQAELTVIQPRIPCYKLAHFLGMPQSFPLEFLKSGRTGFYCAVTRPGAIRRGDTGRWIAAEGPRISISRFIELTQFSTDSSAVAELLGNRHVIDGWKEKIRRRLEQLEAASRRPEDDGWLEVQCQRIDDEGNGIKSFHLYDAAGVLNAARGGQFLTLRRMIGGKPVIRNYSISAPSGAPVVAPGCVRISVKLECSAPGHVGRMSSELHRHVAVGDHLSVRSPSGHFTLSDHAGHQAISLVSGGIGITPMLGMLWQAVAEGRRESICLVHAHRADRAFPFAGELADLTGRLPGLRVELFNTGPSAVPGAGLNMRTGRPDWNPLLSMLGPDGLIYVCGPGALIEAVVSSARAQGLDENAILRESFGTLPAATNGADARISFARSGQTALWTPRDGSLLDLAIRSGIDVRYSCRSGICGTCAVPLLAGKFSYPRGFAAETVRDDRILLCSAVPEGDIVVDI